jgi:CelD/BcsL family acetyltransferase involved in cellulose biosynthesis
VRLTAASVATDSEVRVQEVETLLTLEALRGEWRSLWEECPHATVFQSPEWSIPWCAHLLEGDLRVLALRTRYADELVGICPLFGWQHGSDRVLSLLGAGASDYQDALLHDAHRAACVAALEEWLADADWDRVEWSELPSESPLLSVRLEPAHDEVAEQEVCLGVMLRTEGLDSFVPRVRAHQVAYARRRAERELGLAYEDAGTHNFDDLFSDLERLHALRRNERGENGIVSDARVRAFHRAVARGLLESRRIMLSAVRLDGERAAVLYGFHDGRVSRCYVSGFEPRFSKYSPGLLAVAYGIESALARGKRVFDFLRGTERYKYEWGATDQFRIFRRRARRAPVGPA